MSRYEADGTTTLVGASSRTDAAAPASAGLRTPLGGRNVTTMVCETGQPAASTTTPVPWARELRSPGT